MSEDNAPKSDEQLSQPASRPSCCGGGGFLFPAIILLLLAAWCVKDGFITPEATEHPLFNQIGAVVLGLLGLAGLVHSLLRPRADVCQLPEEKQDKQEDKPFTQE